MTTTRWSLANRLTIWMSAVALLPGLGTVVLGGLFLEVSTAREREALLDEEAEEVLAALRAGTPIEAFPTICRELSAHHPATPLAWRLSHAATGAVLAEAGQLPILRERCTRPMAIEEVIDLGDGFAARTVRAPHDRHLLVAVDGRSLRTFVERYWLIAGILITVSTAVAMFLARWLARRVAGLLLDVAADMEPAAATGELPLREGAPDEIRAVVERLRTQMRRIREGSERMRLFTAGLAHELRSPLQNLIAQAEVTLLRQRDPTAYEAILVSQLDELLELSDAIDNLLTICSASSKPQVESWEEFELSEEARLRLQRERARAEREGIDLEVLTAGDCRIRGDREGALRGIRNVVANAIDWTPRGGQVHVLLEGEPERVVVRVDDSGPGVPEEHRERIFEPFFHGPARLRRRIGYGLGLAIARASATDHGGRIHVETSPLGGARFQLTFLRNRAVPAQDLAAAT